MLQTQTVSFQQVGRSSTSTVCQNIYPKKQSCYEEDNAKLSTVDLEKWFNDLQ